MIFTTNVVDWRQPVIKDSQQVSSLIWKHTMVMLDILQTTNISGTFFIPTKVAIKYPVLVRKIHYAGHEVSCYFDETYNEASFQKIAQDSIHLLEDTLGDKIIGTRHKNLSINNTNFDHYCMILRTQGIQYDSSLVTKQTIDNLTKQNPSLSAFKNYGISQYTLPSFFGLPFGNSTLRLLSYEFSHMLGTQLDKNSAVFQMPIYDLGFNDPSSEHPSDDALWYRKIDFLGRKTVPVKLQKLFADYPFDSFKNYYFDGYR